MNTVQLVAGETLNGGITPIPVYMDKEGLILNQDTGSVDANIFGVNKYAQVFYTDSGTKEIRQINLLLKKVGSPGGNIEVAIHGVDTNSHPLSSPLGTVTLSASALQDGWIECAFSTPVPVTSLTNYAIVVGVPGGDVSNYISWQYSSSSVYGNGSYLSSADFGFTWSPDPTNDFAFRVYSDHRVYSCNSTNVNKTDFLGFATSSANAGESIDIQIDGLVSGFSGLNEGVKYYLGTPSGTIDTSPGKLVGVAISGNTLTTIKMETSNEFKIGQVYWNVGTPPNQSLTITHNLGRIPKLIEVEYIYSCSFCPSWGVGNGLYDRNNYVTTVKVRDGSYTSTSSLIRAVYYPNSGASFLQWTAVVTDNNPNSFTLERFTIEVSRCSTKKTSRLPRREKPLRTLV